MLINSTAEISHKKSAYHDFLKKHSTMKYTNGNQSNAAKMLAINRGTLRKKLKQYNITE